MVGYYYWGFLGDKKYDENGNPVSTPDGNAFYSWSIIKAIQDNGKDVYLFSDRDKQGFIKHGSSLFSSFAQVPRANAYYKTIKPENEFPEQNIEYVIIEWRWEIPGRNDEKTRIEKPDIWQPDLYNMKKIINWCNTYNIPFVIFDLDYKLTEDDIKNYNIKHIIELGNKWSNYNLVKSCKIQIPFDFNYINEFNLVEDPTEFTSDIIYIGNRYERDWCIDKYLPKGTVVHGNWLEPGHGDPENEWPYLKFRKRLTASEIQDPYNKAVSTVLLAKKEYCEQGFMTARIQEAIFYGTVPFFIEEYGENTITEYAGKYKQFLTVRSSEELSEKVEYLKNNINYRNEIIMYLRKHLRFMDCKFFINDIEALLLEK